MACWVLSSYLNSYWILLIPFYTVCGLEAASSTELVAIFYHTVGIHSLEADGALYNSYWRLAFSSSLGATYSWRHVSIVAGLYYQVVIFLTDV